MSGWKNGAGRRPRWWTVRPVECVSGVAGNRKTDEHDSTRGGAYQDSSAFAQAYLSDAAREVSGLNSDKYLWRSVKVTEEEVEKAVTGLYD